MCSLLKAEINDFIFPQKNPTKEALDQYETNVDLAIIANVSLLAENLPAVEKLMESGESEEINAIITISSLLQNSVTQSCSLVSDVLNFT